MDNDDTEEPNSEKENESSELIPESTEEKPAPTSPIPTEPAPTKPAPVKPTPTEPAPTEPAPTEPAPTEPPYDPSKPSPDDWKNSYWTKNTEAYYTSNDLVNMGYIPAGYCEGTTIRIYHTDWSQRENGVGEKRKYKVMELNYSGEQVPEDINISDNLDSNFGWVISYCLHNGVSYFNSVCYTDYGITVN